MNQIHPHTFTSLYYEQACRLNNKLDATNYMTQNSSSWFLGLWSEKKTCVVVSTQSKNRTSLLPSFKISARSGTPPSLHFVAPGGSKLLSRSLQPTSQYIESQEQGRGRIHLMAPFQERSLYTRALVTLGNIACNYESHYAWWVYHIFYTVVYIYIYHHFMDYCTQFWSLKSSDELGAETWMVELFSQVKFGDYDDYATIWAAKSF